MVSGLCVSGLGSVLLGLCRGVVTAEPVLVRLDGGVGSSVVCVVSGWSGGQVRLLVDRRVFKNLGSVVVDGRVLGVACDAAPVDGLIDFVDDGGAGVGGAGVGGAGVGGAGVGGAGVVVAGSFVPAVVDGVVGLWRAGVGEEFVLAHVWGAGFGDWCGWLRRCGLCVSTDDGRPMLCCVDVSVDGSGRFVAAVSDSYRLLVDRSVPDPDFVPGDADGMPVWGVESGRLALPYAALALFTKMVRAAGGVKAGVWPVEMWLLNHTTSDSSPVDADGEAKPDRVLLSCGPVDMIVACVDGKHVEWQRIIPPDAVPVVVCVDPATVRAWLNKIRVGLTRKKSSAGPVLLVRVHISGEGVVLSVQDVDTGAVMRYSNPAGLFAVNAVGDPTEFLFNIKYLGAVLGCFTGPVEWGCVPSQPLGVWTVTHRDNNSGVGDHRLALLMPVSALKHTKTPR